MEIDNLFFINEAEKLEIVLNHVAIQRYSCGTHSGNRTVFIPLCEELCPNHTCMPSDERIT